MENTVAGSRAQRCPCVEAECGGSRRDGVTWCRMPVMKYCVLCFRKFLQRETTFLYSIRGQKLLDGEVGPAAWPVHRCAICSCLPFGC